MMNVAYETAEDIKLDFIIVEKKFVNGEHKSYRLIATEGYVIYDKKNDEKPEGIVNNINIGKDFYKCVTVPVRYTPDTWQWEAIPESKVSETDRIN
jgi:hypothetical protein